VKVICLYCRIDFCSHTDKDGERVGWTKWGDNMEKDHGAPYYHIHVSHSGSRFIYPTYPYLICIDREPISILYSLISLSHT